MKLFLIGFKNLPHQIDQSIIFPIIGFVRKKKKIYNLVDRAIFLSHTTFHGANFKIVKQILLNNDYPNSFIDKNIKIRMNKIKYSSPNSLNKKKL